MVDSLTQISRMSQSTTRSSTEYPLQSVFIKWGSVAALLGGVCFVSPLAGLAFFVVFAVAGAVWRPGEPALAYCLAFQWLFIVTGYFYFCVTGAYPEDGIVGDIDAAVLLCLAGLIALAAGMRSGIAVLAKTVDNSRPNSKDWQTPYDIPRLFWLTIAFGAVNWFTEISPMLIWFDGAQIIYRLLQFRHLFFFLLLLTVIRRQHGFDYGAVAFLVYLVPALTSHMSAFSGPFIVLFLAAVSEWRPWSRHGWERWRSNRAYRHAAVIAMLLVVMGLVWTGGVKGVWRPRVLSGEVSGSPLDKAFAFTATVAETAPNIRVGSAGHDLSKRMSSDVGYFADTLARVPVVVPHANGNLTWRAVNHVLKPRILFPDKENLGSDSWLVELYAGRAAAGWESNTSIALGYMAEFYIDYGIPGMFVALFTLGTLVGLLYRSAILFCPSYDLYRAVVFGLAAHFSTYGAELAKMTGGLLQTYIIFGGLLLVLGRPIHRFLLTPQASIAVPKRRRPWKAIVHVRSR